MEEMKQGARGHMRSTPYVVSKQKESAYSKLRTSKVKSNLKLKTKNKQRKKIATIYYRKINNC